MWEIYYVYCIPCGKRFLCEHFIANSVRYASSTLRIVYTMWERMLILVYTMGEVHCA